MTNPGKCAALLGITAHEFRYHVLSARWMAFGLLSFVFGFFSLRFIAAAQLRVIIGLNDNVNINSPFLVTYSLLFLSLFGSLALPSFVGSAALRDTAYRFDQVLYTLPITRFDYLVGKFCGSFAAAGIAVLGAAIGMALGELLLPFEPQSLGPISVASYLGTFFAFVLPSMLSLAVIVFSVAAMTRNVLNVYVAVLFALVLFYIGYVSVFPGHPVLEALLSPFMLNAFIDESRTWTVIERNTSVIGYNAQLLLNRLLWFGIAALAAGLLYRRFSFRIPTTVRKGSAGNAQPEEALTETSSDSGQVANPSWGMKAKAAQYLARTRFELAAVLRSGPLLMLLGITASFQLLNTRDFRFPATWVMVEALTERLKPVLLFVLIYYAADILWRERNRRFDEIIDATPVPDWVFSASKLTALLSVLVTVVVFQIALSICWQLLNGYTSFELGLYAERGLVYFLLGFLPLVGAAWFLHVLARSRFIGMISVFLFMVGVSFIGFLAESADPFLLFALSGSFLTDVTAPLSDMNGSGRFVVGGYWLRAYGASFAILAILAAYLLWSRGTLQPFLKHVRSCAVRSNAWTYACGCFAAIASFAAASVVYYNMYLVNGYITDSELDEIKAAYERNYRQYQTLPRPRWTDVRSEVDILPDIGRVETRSTQTMVNDASQAITTVHLVFPVGLAVSDLALEGARLVSQDGPFNYSIFDLDTPMQIGEERTLSYKSVMQVEGFEHRHPNLSVARNGTYVLNQEISPHIGFDPRHLVIDEDSRARLDLPPLAELVHPDDFDRGAKSVYGPPGFVNFEATVSTVAQQTAIAPGRLEDEWETGDRRYFRYKAEAPILNLFPYLSASYETARSRWEDVDIDVFYHSSHRRNIDLMIESVRDSLSEFSRRFGPYAFGHLRIVETPALHNSAQGWPGIVTVSEGAGFLARPDTETMLMNGPYLLLAHETAHEWWANQVMPAGIQGHEMLTEAFASYGMLLVAEKQYGYLDVRRLLQLYQVIYFISRARDLTGEVPLYLAVTEDYITYRKGPLVMYALRDYVGDGPIDRSFRRLIALYAGTTDATSVGFLDILKDEAGPEHATLIEDLFERITLYDMAVTGTRLERLPDGRFAVQVGVSAAKIHTDSKGNETRARIDYPVDIGIFSRSPDDPDFSSEDVIYLRKHSIDAGSSAIEIVTDRRPVFVGIDPYRKLIDRDLNDNLLEVSHGRQN